jgi:hypothetical protein
MPAVLARWPKPCREGVLMRAVRGPLSGLRLNLAHFRERTAQFCAEGKAHRLSRSRVWRIDSKLMNRAY